MFLLNSQVPPLPLRPTAPVVTTRAAGHPPFSRSYGANLPSSLARGHPSRLGLLTQEHLCRFSVRSWGLAPPHPPFSWAPPGVGWTGLKARLFPPSAGSRHYGTPPRPSAVKRGYSPPPTLSRGVEGGGACVAARPTPTAREY